MCVYIYNPQPEPPNPEPPQEERASSGGESESEEDEPPLCPPVRYLTPRCVPLRYLTPRYCLPPDFALQSAAESAAEVPGQLSIASV